MTVDDKAVVAAWAEPARGCYAAAIEVKGEAAADEIVPELAKLGVAAHDVVTAEASVTFSFVRSPYQGHAQANFDAQGAGGRLCFWNEREPEACAAACGRWMR
jgi:hypothetical protein